MVRVIPFPVLMEGMVQMGSTLNKTAKSHSKESVWTVVKNICSTVASDPKGKFFIYYILTTFKASKVAIHKHLTLAKKPNVDTIRFYEFIGFSLGPSSREFLADQFMANERANEVFTYTNLSTPGMFFCFF